MNQKGFAPIIMLLFIAGVLAIGGWFYLGKNTVIPTEKPQTQPSAETTLPAQSSSKPVSHSTGVATATLAEINTIPFHPAGALFTWRENNVEFAITSASPDYRIVVDCPEGCNFRPVIINFQLLARNDNLGSTSSVPMKLREINGTGNLIDYSFSPRNPQRITLGPNATTSVNIRFEESNGGTKFIYTTDGSLANSFSAAISSDGKTIEILH